jgi:hypothetical protein
MLENHQIGCWKNVFLKSGVGCLCIKNKNKIVSYFKSLVPNKYHVNMSGSGWGKKIKPSIEL